MEKLNLRQSQTLLEKLFPCFEIYKESEYLKSLDENFENLKYSFCESHLGALFCLEEKVYKDEEREKIVKDLLTSGKIEIMDLKNLCKSLFVLCNPEFKLLPEKIKDSDSVKNLLPDVFTFRKSNSVIVNPNDFSESIIIQFLSIPFLFSYMDLYILPFEQNEFYYCNHHLDVFKVSYKLRQNFRG
ncbi:MAG: hypothetical protein PUF61_12625 [Spirochaetales bacterium]|nr:hypothetical protein [Spirochaetales bacterium]